MSGPQTASAAPIESKAQLVDYLAAGSKPVEDWRIGTEHEKFAFRLSDLKPLPYDGPDGIRAVLEGLAGCGWERVEENGKLIALARGKASVTLEPGGQAHRPSEEPAGVGGARARGEEARPEVAA